MQYRALRDPRRHKKSGYRFVNEPEVQEPGNEDSNPPPPNRDSGSDFPLYPAVYTNQNTMDTV